MGNEVKYVYLNISLTNKTNLFDLLSHIRRNKQTNLFNGHECDMLNSF